MDITEGEVYTDGGMTITFDGRHLKVVLGATGERALYFKLK